MKFTLTYDGSLPSAGNARKAKAIWEMRKAFHPQLEDLLHNHPALGQLGQNDQYPIQGAMMLQGHHSLTGRLPLVEPFLQDPNFVPGQTANLNAPITKHGHQFRPLVRDTYALHCGLKIVFLRKEPPGRVYQGGDLDGRIKTLLDALAMPQHVEQVRQDPHAPSPMLCVLEDDTLVSGLHVESERLLTDQSHSQDYVRLVIEIDIRVRQATIYNQPFLAG